MCKSLADVRSQVRFKPSLPARLSNRNMASQLLDCQSFLTQNILMAVFGGKPLFNANEKVTLKYSFISFVLLRDYFTSFNFYSKRRTIQEPNWYMELRSS